ncbi:glycosyltransferase family 2 protein [Rhodoferax mekongensis]|uniref:Glycosyltransferase family 2 protein n=1 Tax=Rhodoferax mekongensis TaxID=3068341 RepID=A0ABZ0AWW1_9BURK|nr:glycosyltransferase family 2 protein [Rhodoferax sp. TBRC 17307]WNO03706.1 glycosyltransferase family 2 protein [Rhodoferax sp. TBRC 17307]
MPSKELISIVITTYNRSDALGCVLSALERQSDRDFEVIVADDGSSNAHVANTRSIQSNVNFPVIHVWHPDVGFTAAKVRNLGVAQASGDYLVLLDGDCVPEVDFVRRHRMLQEKGHFVNGSRVLLGEGLTQSAISKEVDLTDQSTWWWLGRRLSGQASKWTAKFRWPDLSIRRQPEFRWKGIRSCNMALRKSDYVAINGFDESFVGWGHEDADFVLRLHNAGLCRKNGFFSTEVYHLWHPESSRDLENANALRVRERITSKQIVATIGYQQSLGFDQVQVYRR